MIRLLADMRFFALLCFAVLVVPAFAANSGCETQHVSMDRIGPTFAFICPDQTNYVVRTTDREAWVFHHTGTLRIPAIEKDLGTYSDGRFELRINGNMAQLGHTDKPPQTCRNDARRAVWEKAKLDGTDFRAVGNEPPWVLEIRNQSCIVLTTEYGARREEFQLPTAIEDGAAQATRWITDNLQIEVTMATCHDNMSGEAFESRVTIKRPGQVLQGCGRALH